MQHWHIKRAAEVLRAGGIVAYPTEGVYGLGCDPLDALAVTRLLALKGRRAQKGFILIADHWSRLAPYVYPLPDQRMEAVFATWPGPVTWLLPARPEVPRWLCGEHHTVAVRVTAHPTAAALCREYGGALISTSANRQGLRPACTALTARRRFGRQLDYLLNGETAAPRRPTQIRDGLTGAVIRPGGPASETTQPQGASAA